MFIPGALLWYFITRQYPRTAGDYVYFSRLNPPIGFAAWFNFTVGEMLYDAVLVYFAAAQLGMVMQALNNPLANAVLNPRNEFIIAVMLITILIMVNIVSARAGLMMFTIISLTALATFMASAIYVLSLPRKFIEGMLGSAFIEAVSEASKASVTGGLYGLFGMAAFTTAVWAYVNYPVTIGGEIRRDRLTALLGVIGMFILGGLFFTLFVAAFLKGFGLNFYVGAGYMNSNDIDNGFLLINPAVDLALLRTPLSIALAYSSVLWYIAPVTGVIIQVSRYLLAFSMDRVLPRALSYVSLKTHSPIVAHLVDLVITVALMYILILTPFSSALLYAIDLDALILLIFTFIASILLALVMHMKGTTKLGVDRRALIALDVTYLAVLSIFAYYWLTQPQYYLFITGNPLQLLAESSIIFVIGLVIFIVTDYVRSRQGIPLRLVYMEIPPE
ncbi:APC family permease [Vulcanisaeta sp. JCM 16161]|uniref:APC family permease n=1 Tax=Vulcanisaeta sp. JCM 16161 TaxID=1295372 RepID=UPI0006D2185D|nr:APC family permease [Vulcanisaeta sp. JCM 16161]